MIDIDWRVPTTWLRRARFGKKGSCELLIHANYQFICAVSLLANIQPLEDFLQINATGP